MNRTSDLLRSLLKPGAAERVMQGLPAREPNADLRTSLRVIASRERQRRIARRDLQSRIGLLRDSCELLWDGFVRSVALPFAGGLASAVLLFSMFVVPTYPLRAHSTPDVPTVLTTEVAIKMMSPFAGSEGDVVVDVRVDGQGRMVDYTVVSGASVVANPEMRRRLENVLLFTEFTPATSFGQPMPSTMRLWFRSSRIDVKG